ncbi:two-component system, NarL family, response regulator YdfI [Evansella caseinilytica]|uniref:Two-component system, NarL family, response regulator YdfI n=1 Tax=Evansella caseinilytica TaxID=1503961 RepID=A0A1H3I375_9BACI|nr:response regulator transcription factor [Evansella caseinilytica]SDY22163.1 two-component system, NarL family, response regulator YdfI [Evansella caseinilytica]
MTHKIVIVDDHFVVREGLKLILETNDSFQVVGEAENGQLALDIIEETQPDVILLDLNMPVMTGLETIQTLNDRNVPIPIIILTTYNEDELMIRAMKLGAKGYLLKDTDRDHLFRTIESAVRGETLLQADLMAKLLATPSKELSSNHPFTKPHLTEKERLIVQLAARGYKSKEIAFDMGIAERTVKAHLTNIYNKLGVDSRSEAVAVAVARGWVQL